MPFHGETKLKHEQTRKKLTILIITLMGISAFTPMTFASAKTAGNLHGTVVDLNGDPVEDVKVMAYLST